LTRSWSVVFVTFCAASVNVEPGSGSAIMGYAGITTDYDVQASSDDYFAYVGILQIQTNLAENLSY
jgi:hypothetical protein